MGRTLRLASASLLWPVRWLGCVVVTTGAPGGQRDGDHHYERKTTDKHSQGDVSQQILPAICDHFLLHDVAYPASSTVANALDTRKPRCAGRGSACLR